MTKPFPQWAIILYRGVRAGVSAGIMTVGVALGVLKLDLTKPAEAARVLLLTVVVAFGSGFITAFGKWLRNYLDEAFGYNEKSTVAKIMPI